MKISKLDGRSKQYLEMGYTHRATSTGLIRLCEEQYRHLRLIWGGTELALKVGTGGNRRNTRITLKAILSSLTCYLLCRTKWSNITIGEIMNEDIKSDIIDLSEKGITPRRIAIILNVDIELVYENLLPETDYHAF